MKPRKALRVFTVLLGFVGIIFAMNKASQAQGTAQGQPAVGNSTAMALTTSPMYFDVTQFNKTGAIFVAKLVRRIRRR
jgi:hypothetical protein